jgi:hypothetical protein
MRMVVRRLSSDAWWFHAIRASLPHAVDAWDRLLGRAS